MTVIAHISDLHFGALREETLTPLKAALSELRPQVVVVSGDLTQRGRPEQFRAARTFLHSLPCERLLVVPGNHDVPLWNPLRRFVRPLRDFRRIVEPEHYPTFVDRDVAIIGINTARSATIANGRVNRVQLSRISRFLDGQGDRRIRIVVAHHPFALPEDTQERRVGRARRGLAAFVDSRVDLLLTGHRHQPWIRTLEPGLVTVHAGTATSSRTRGHPNSFHEAHVAPEGIRIRRWDWRARARTFAAEAETEHFPREQSSAAVPSGAA